MITCLALQDNKIYKIKEYVDDNSGLHWTGADVHAWPAIMRYEVFDGYVEMVQIYVAEDGRRHGVGKKLMKNLEKIVKGLGIYRIIITAAVRPDEVFGQFLEKMKYYRVFNSDRPYDFFWEKKLRGYKKNEQRKLVA